MRLVTEEGFDSVLPIVKFGFPPQRAFVMNGASITFQHPENMRVRSQDLEVLYHDAGQFCCFDVKKFMAGKSLIMDKTGAIVLPESEVQDIDTLEDWKIAEIKYGMMIKRGDN
jgi:N-acylneuraminate cytidylyltransferase